MQPSIIKTTNREEKKIEAWLNGIDQTGYMRTSAIPDLAAMATHTENRAHILLDAIDFNEHICPKVFRKVIDLSLFKIDSSLAMLDFGMQRVDSHLLEHVLTWLDQQQVCIKQLNLATVAQCETAWRYLMRWLQQTRCEVHGIALGRMNMSMPLLRDMTQMLKHDHLKLSRFDFGASQWDFQSVKAFLWMGGLSCSPNLIRIAMGDAHLCADGLRLFLEHIGSNNSRINIFSSGVVELPAPALERLLERMIAKESKMASLVLSNQSLDDKTVMLLGRLIASETNLSHLALMNCWYDHSQLLDAIECAGVKNLYLETVTAGQIQILTDGLLSRGYTVERQINRHRIKLKRVRTD